MGHAKPALIRSFIPEQFTKPDVVSKRTQMVTIIFSKSVRLFKEDVEEKGKGG